MDLNSLMYIILSHGALNNFLFFPFLKRILNAPIIQPGQLSHLFLFSNWTNPSLTFLQITSCKKVYYMKTMIEKSSVRGKFQQFSSIIFGRVNMTGYDIKATQSWFLFAVPPIQSSLLCWGRQVCRSDRYKTYAIFTSEGWTGAV